MRQPSWVIQGIQGIQGQRHLIPMSKTESTRNPGKKKTVFFGVYVVEFSAHILMQSHAVHNEGMSPV